MIPNVRFVCVVLVFTGGVGTEILNSGVIENEKVATESKNRPESRQTNVTFERYMKFDEIQSYLDEVVSTFPDVATIEQVGTSYEGRPLRVLKLSRGGNKPGVFIDAGIHAAEWLGPPMALYTISQLTGASQELLDLADWYILPVANPDGYVYAWTEDRFWRKNRKPINGSDCIGIDLNRNFNIYWGASNDSDPLDPCSETYQGPSAHSEAETRGIADLMSTKNLSLYMTVHAYSQYLMYPYGFKTDLPTSEVISAADDAVNALKRIRGTDYSTGTLANMLYLAFGNSQDYAYDVVGVPFAYTWELPPAGGTDFDVENFNPPSSEIRPVVEETWEGFKVLVRRATAPSAAMTEKYVTQT